MSTGPKKPGLQAFDRATLATHYANHGTRLRSTHTNTLKSQLQIFQSLLQNFSQTHAKDIRSNPQFRAEFARMCNAIGVDPLLSSSTHSATSASSRGDGAGSGSESGKGVMSRLGSLGGFGGLGSLWSGVLGESVNDFYFDLAVRIVQLCRKTRAENGGMISVSEVAVRLPKSKKVGGFEGSISEDDIIRAVAALEPLQSGFKIMKVGSRRMIRSVPKELNTDQSVALEAIQVLGYITVSMLQINLGWSRPRVKAVLEDLVADSLVWVDEQAEEEIEYWSPSFIHEVGYET